MCPQHGALRFCPAAGQASGPTLLTTLCRLRACWAAPAPACQICPPPPGQRGQAQQQAWTLRPGSSPWGWSGACEWRWELSWSNVHVKLSALLMLLCSCLPCSGAPVGDSSIRAAAAEALLAVADSAALYGLDSDTLRQLVLAMDGVLAGEAAARQSGGWRIGELNASMRSGLSAAPAPALQSARASTQTPPPTLELGKGACVCGDRHTCMHAGPPCWLDWLVHTAPAFAPPHSDEKWMHEPAVSGLLREEQGVPGGGASAKWRRRWPRWLVAEKVFLNLEWRASQVR